MRVPLANGRAPWLTYCMNVHPGGTVASTRAAIRDTVLPLRERLVGSSPFALGLRFDAETTAALARAPDACRAFADELEADDLIPVTANAFVAGAFHGQAVKEQVYAPSWEDPARVRYTLDTAEVLLRLAPRLERSTISTAPGSWRAWVRDREADADRACAANLAAAARGLKALADDTGRHVALGLEPEPGCTIQTVAEAIRFFQGPLADALRGDDDARSRLGLCYDVCHQAVLHEDVVGGLRRLAAARIPVVKLQASCALEVSDPGDRETRAALAVFDEPVYLHQVGARDGDGTVHVATDLPQALKGGGAWERRRPWRVHFHVPVDREVLSAGLATTRQALDEALAALATLTDVEQIEIETYTWDVLPPSEREGGLVSALEREYRYVLSGLPRRGAAREGRES